MEEQDLGYIEYYGQMVTITWDDYINIIWNKDPHIEIIKVPKIPDFQKE